MDKKLPFTSYLAIGMMLFALFFGAGNLIFPAHLGQEAGMNVWPALAGFILTGAGLPLLGILAIGFSGSANLQQLAGRVHPLYGILFTVILYLTIGPFFAAPRTGAVAYDVIAAPFISEGDQQIGLGIFTFLFFGITLWLSLRPAKLVDRIGKLLSPALIILMLILVTMVFVKPIGILQEPSQLYASGSFMKGFTEGYHTMDALASLVFGMIIITSIRSLGVTSKPGILKAAAKTGLVATAFLALFYAGIGYLGATGASVFGTFETGGPILSNAASYYFGVTGTLMLNIAILLACLTTSIGLITACGEYFHSLMPKISYSAFVILFTAFCFMTANFGLAKIITYSVPVLVVLYPLAVVLMLLVFLSPFFAHNKIVYRTATAVTFAISLLDGIEALLDSLKMTAPNWVLAVTDFYNKVLPYYEIGLGWLLPSLLIIFIGGLWIQSKRSIARKQLSKHSA